MSFRSTSFYSNLSDCMYIQQHIPIIMHAHILGNNLILDTYI